ncbi:MAG: molybdenum ABC transporter ATP-binding protein [Planctomycetota bacterium]
MIHLDVQFERGEFAMNVACDFDAPITGVVGPSGAGKTTLINLIAGLEVPDAGVIRLGDDVLVDTDSRVSVPVHRRAVGMVFQEHRLFPHYSVRGNLAYARPANARLAEVAELLELTPLLTRRVHELSGGEQQRVALGRALLRGPRLLLLDEPLSSLDARLKRQIIPLLRRIHEALGVPMIYVGHDLAEILQLTDDLLVLDRGRVAGQGRYSDLVHDSNVLPVIHDRGILNLVRTQVSAHDAQYAQTTVRISPQAQTSRSSSVELSIPGTSGAIGDSVTLAIAPWDIALARTRIDGVSIRNQLPATVRRWSDVDGRTIVELDVGVPLIAEISVTSAAAIELAVGAPMVCLIKSHAIRRLDAPAPHSTSGHSRSVSP